MQKKTWLLEPARVAKGPDLADRPVVRRPTLKLRMRSLYRGLRFYIDDHDLDSKAAFNALYDLWQLAVKAPATQAKPVTTIQVN